MNISFILSIIISYLIAILAIAFYTLLERKALGYFQIRKGPNKVGLIGIPQPFADAIKLFTKEQTKPIFANIYPYILSPIIRLILALLLWGLFPFSNPSYFIKFGILLFLCISRINVYTTLIAGWSSNSKYALLGSLRRVAQTISYEIRIALILLSILLIHISFFISYVYYSKSSWIMLCSLPICFTWFITTLAETNRTPFDLAEGESELVSGFNTEYSGGRFALIFIAEYANILIIRLLSIIFFTNAIYPTQITRFVLILKTILLAWGFIWIRASFPRIRYDRLINLTWKTFLPLSLAYLTLTISLIKII